MLSPSSTTAVEDGADLFSNPEKVELEDELGRLLTFPAIVAGLLYELGDNSDELTGSPVAPDDSPDPVDIIDPDMCRGVDLASEGGILLGGVGNGTEPENGKPDILLGVGDGSPLSGGNF